MCVPEPQSALQPLHDDHSFQAQYRKPSHTLVQLDASFATRASHGAPQ
jgi:hypothetical protein